MPVSRKHARTADLRTQAADKMQIDLKYVFFLPKSRSKPVLAIWTEGWSGEEIQRVKAMKREIKAMAAAVGAKIYMTPIHPHEQELRELARRKTRGRRHRQRQSEKQALKKRDNRFVTAVQKIWTEEEMSTGDLLGTSPRPPRTGDDQE